MTENTTTTNDYAAITVSTFSPAFRWTMAAAVAIITALYTGFLPAPPVNASADPVLSRRLDALELALLARVDGVRNDVGTVAELVAPPKGAVPPATRTDIEELRAALLVLAARIDAAAKSRPESPPKRK